VEVIRQGRGYGWRGSVGEFLESPERTWLAALEEHHRGLLGTPASGSQAAAWRVEHRVLASALRDLCLAEPAAQAWGVVFEFELPLEGGRRPDVVLLAGGSVVVLEFKSTGTVRQPDIDQTDRYARDLADYHEASQGRVAKPILVLAAASALAEQREDVIVTGPDGLGQYLDATATPGTINLDSWLEAPYAPLPTLVEAARRIFRDGELPHVKCALSLGIPATVELLARLVREASEGRRRLLTFVTGVPGSGKTLVGLRLVYERSDGEGRATFLSGNGPLVKVLQDALDSRVFVRDLHAFVRTYAINKRTPGEHILVFDEAQRAWDREYMQLKRGIPGSEPELLIGVAERIPDWSALVGLVGEGQEIHSGEEAGMPQWCAAASPPTATRTWTVHCPPKLALDFEGLDVTTHEQLDLTASLRSRQAEELHRWVALLLEGSLALAARLAVRVRGVGYQMYVTRDLAEAKAYVRARYAEEAVGRYGLLASSHARILSEHGVPNDFMATSRMNIAKWFNAEPSDSRSSCALTQPVTEFGCQGLELDFPIVCWGEDYRWAGDGWALTPIRRKYPQQDPVQLLRNVYRVLLTRGRDGMVVFVPDDRELDTTEHAVLAAGVVPLPDHLEPAEPAAQGA